MSQFLRILRKDARHLRIELALVVGLTVYFVYSEWLSFNPPFDQPWYLGQLPGPLLLFSWWILSVRAVHLEPLVGDRQFWVTRPYDWKKLLLSKLTVIFLAILFPLLIGETWLTWKCGYSPLSSVGTILTHVLFSPVFATLPLVVLAALTRKITQWLLCIIGGILCIALLAWASTHASSAALGGLSEWPGAVQMLSFYGISLAALILQYARRRTLHAWGLLFLAVASIPLVMFTTPYERMIGNTFTQINGSDAPFRLRGGTGKGTAWGRVDGLKPVSLSLPVYIEGVPAGVAVVPVGMRFIVDAEDGSRWEQGWRQGSSIGPIFFSGAGENTLTIEVEREFFRRIEKKNAHVRVTVAWLEYKYTNPTRVIADDQFLMTGVGPCWLRTDNIEPVSCRTLANGSTPFVVEVRSDESTCKFGNDQRPPSGLVAHYINNDRQPESFNAVELRSIYLFTWDFQSSTQLDAKDIRPHLCPGSAIWVSRPELVAKRQMQFDLGQIAIPEMKKLGGDGAAVGVSIAR